MTDTNIVDAPKPSTKMQPTDLGDLDTVAASDKGAEIELMHPATKEPTGIFIGLLGKHSTVFQSIVNERTNQRLKDEALRAKRNKDFEPVTAEKVIDRAVELLAACSTHWRTVTKDSSGKVVEEAPSITLRGEVLPFNANNAIRIYKAMPWVREQVDAGVGDLENFMKD
jgi:hypothetical protein